MLKQRITQDDYDQLAATDQAHYRKSGDAWVLETDESSRLQRALDSERRMRETADRFLGELVPALLDDESSTGFVDRKHWRRHVEGRGELLELLDAREDLDVEALQRLLDGEGGGGDDGDKGGGDDEGARARVQELETENRRLTRELTRATRDKDTAVTERDRLQGENDGLVLDRGIDEAMDAINVRGQKRRKLVRLLWRDAGMIVRDGEVFVTEDGAEVALEEFARGWSETEDGKEYVSAADGSGGGDGGTPPAGAKEKPAADLDKMGGNQLIAHAFAGGRKAAAKQ